MKEIFEIKNDARLWVVTYSIKILRSKGKTDDEIKTEILRDFTIDEKQLDDLMKVKN